MVGLAGEGCRVAVRRLAGALLVCEGLLLLYALLAEVAGGDMILECSLADVAGGDMFVECSVGSPLPVLGTGMSQGSSRRA